MITTWSIGDYRAQKGVMYVLKLSRYSWIILFSASVSFSLTRCSGNTYLFCTVCINGITLPYFFSKVKDTHGIHVFFVLVCPFLLQDICVSWKLNLFSCYRFYIEGDIIYVLICKLLFIYEICGTPVIVKARKDIVMLLWCVLIFCNL